MSYRDIAMGLYGALEEAIDAMMEADMYEQAKAPTLALGYFAVKLREQGEEIGQTFFEALMEGGEDA